MGLSITLFYIINNVCKDINIMLYKELRRGFFLSLTLNHVSDIQILHRQFIIVFFEKSSMDAFQTECLINTAHLQSSVFKLSKDLIDSIHEEGIVAYTS